MMSTYASVCIRVVNTAKNLYSVHIYQKAILKFVKYDNTSVIYVNLRD
jgi:hypothetical protein